MGYKMDSPTGVVAAFLPGPTTVSAEEKRQCRSCRRDAPISFFSEAPGGRGLEGSCSFCMGRAPPLLEWVQSKLSNRLSRVTCECGAVVASVSLSTHRNTAVHRSKVTKRAMRDESFAAHIRELETARIAAYEDRLQRQDANVARVEQEARFKAAAEAARLLRLSKRTAEEKARDDANEQRYQALRISRGLSAVYEPKQKPARTKCPECGSEIVNARSNIKMHRKSQKHLNAVLKAVDPQPHVDGLA